MMQATSCPSAPALQRFLLGQTGEEESTPLEQHLLQCEQCLCTVRSLPADDPLISALQQGREFAAQTPRSELLEKLRRRLQDMRPAARGVDTATANTAATLPPGPSSFEGTQEIGLSLAPAQQSDEIGRLGGYRILKELGRGGMGVVFKAEDVRLKRTVALKAMLPGLAVNPNAGQRFLREAQAMAAVEHDHIVRIYQVDEDRGVPFLAMEFLKGEPLDERLKRESRGEVTSPLPLAEVLRIGREIAEGLAAAHANGLIHRDIKPGNVWLEAPRGRVKILDFGLARAAASPDAALTQQGAIVGTPAYMAPEQARGETVDGRCDLFSLGVVLYRLCTGRQPFRGSDSISTLMEVALHEPASPIQINPDLPQELSDMVMKLLEKDPARRFAAAGEVVQAIQALEKRLARKNGVEDRTEALQTAAPRRRRVSALTACLTALLGLGLAAVTAVIVVKVRTPDGKETEVAAPTGSKVAVDPQGGVTVTLPGDAPAAAGTEITNSIGMKLKLLQPGTFIMGSAQDEESHSDNEGPQHDVEITKAFYMGACPVTKGQFAAFVKDDGYQTDAEKDGKGGFIFNLATGKGEQKAECTWRHPGFSQGDDHPVVEVSRNDATAFCAWLSKKEGKTYELPTEAEWEYACRAGTRTRFWCGEADAGLQGNANIADASLREKCPGAGWAVAWDDGYAFTSPVGSFKANPWGLYDMGGNVWQWCADGYDKYQPGPIKDPKCKENANVCVLRGGSWHDQPRKCRSAYRFMTVAALRNDDVSFRVVLRPPASQRPQPVDDAFMQKVAALPADMQVEAVAAKLKELNPGFDGKATPTIENGVVVGLEFLTNEVTDIAPVTALVGLRTLKCGGVIDKRTGRLADLSPLKDMKLTNLSCGDTQVSDLSPLKDMKLTNLSCGDTQVSDLSPLKDMKLTGLECSFTLVSDLSPLKDMKLTGLGCHNTKVSDLMPLKDMKLTWLNCGGMPVSDLSPLKDMKLTDLRCGQTTVSDLSPLKGMPLTTLYCEKSKVSDLSPLKDMKLTELGFWETPVSDLSPLKNMPLQNLRCDFHPWRDTELLRSITTLTRINDKPAADFWKEVDAQRAAFDAWCKQVAAMTPDEQVKAVADELKKVNPGFDGKVTPTIENGVVVGLEFLTDDVTDIAPVRALVGLRTLKCDGTWGKARLADLSPVKDMKLTALWCRWTNVSDLSPLKDMKLTALYCSDTLVSDLSPLKDMKLTGLSCFSTKVSDLSPLKDMKLTNLYCGNTKMSDLSPLKGMPLTVLHCDNTQVSDLLPLSDMKLTSLDIAGTPVSDLGPLKGLPLKALWCDFKPERDAEVLRSIQTLETINGKSAAEFWKDVDAKKP